MRAYCKKCKVLIYVEGDVKRRGNGEIIKHCNVCGNESYEVEGI